MLSDMETVQSAKICQDVISLKRGSLKFQWSHTLTHTHTKALSLALNSSQEVAIWQFRSTSYGSSSLLSLLLPPISVFSFVSLTHSSSLPASLFSSHLPPLLMAVGAFPRSALELARPPSSAGTCQQIILRGDCSA